MKPQKEEAKLLRRLGKHCNAINAVLADAKKIYPKACLYLSGTGGLHLMSGPHHLDFTNSDEHGEKANATAIIGSAQIHADSGDW